MRVLLIACLILTLCVAGCTDLQKNPMADGAGLENPDAPGQTPASVARLVTLAPGETEIVCALGMGDLLVGRSDYCNYPPSVTDIPSVGGPKTVSIERVIRLEPDLVFATTITDAATAEGLRAAGLEVRVFRLETLEDVYRNIEDVGELLGCPGNASSLIEGLRERETAVQAATYGREPPRAMYVLWDDPLYVAGSDTLQDDLIKRAGGINVFEDAEGYIVVSDEAVVNRGPEVIIICEAHTAGTGDIRERLLGKQTLSDVPALRTMRIYTVDADTVNRPGPRLIDALEAFSACLHA